MFPIGFNLDIGGGGGGIGKADDDPVPSMPPRPAHTRLEPPSGAGRRTTPRSSSPSPGGPRPPRQASPRPAALPRAECKRATNMLMEGLNYWVSPGVPLLFPAVPPFPSGGLKLFQAHLQSLVERHGKGDGGWGGRSLADRGSSCLQPRLQARGQGFPCSSCDHQPPAGRGGGGLSRSLRLPFPLSLMRLGGAQLKGGGGKTTLESGLCSARFAS